MGVSTLTMRAGTRCSGHLLYRIGIFSRRRRKNAVGSAGLAELTTYKQSRQFSDGSLGGISIARAVGLDCGVGSIAVVSAITQAPDWRAATAELLALCASKVPEDA